MEHVAGSGDIDPLALVSGAHDDEGQMNDDVGIGNQCVDGAAVQNVALPIRRLQPPPRCRVKRPARHAVNTLDCRFAFERRYGRGPDLAGRPRDGHSQCHGLHTTTVARIAV